MARDFERMDSDRERSGPDRDRDPIERDVPTGVEDEVIGAGGDEEFDEEEEFDEDEDEPGSLP